MLIRQKTDEEKNAEIYKSIFIDGIKAIVLPTVIVIIFFSMLTLLSFLIATTIWRIS